MVLNDDAHDADAQVGTDNDDDGEDYSTDSFVGAGAEAAAENDHAENDDAD